MKKNKFKIIKKPVITKLNYCTPTVRSPLTAMTDINNLKEIPEIRGEI